MYIAAAPAEGDATGNATMLVAANSHAFIQSDLPATATEDLSATQEDDALMIVTIMRDTIQRTWIAPLRVQAGSIRRSVEDLCHAGMVGRGGEGRDASIES